jgi:hypothetical protein
MFINAVAPGTYEPTITIVEREAIPDGRSETERERKRGKNGRRG